MNASNNPSSPKESNVRKLVASLIFATLALAPNALAGGNAVTDACPSDNKQKIQNVSLSVTQGGDTTARFTINPACSTVKVSLVTYTHSAPFFTWENSVDERVYQRKTQVLGPGSYSLTVKTPNCYYQADLVEGEVIEQLGPAGTNNFYTPQGRLIAAENGGDRACTAETAPVIQTVDVCKNIAGDQETVPEGRVKKGDNCVVVAVKGKKKVTVKGKKAPKPKKLPYTP